ATLQAAYPWAGAWAGERWATLAAWAAVYALYYVSFEFFYRGFVLHVARASWGAAAGIWLQVAMATLVHLGKPLPEMLAAAPASLVFGAIAPRRRSVLDPVLPHGVSGRALDVAGLGRQGQLLP